MSDKETKLNKSGSRLADWLRDIGMKQSELARELDYTENYISYIVTGKRPMTLKFAQRVSDLTCQGQSQRYSKEVRIRPEYLLGLDDIRTTEDFESIYIQRQQATGSAALALLDQALREVCLREGIDPPTLSNVPENILLVSQLRDFSINLMYSYLHRDTSYFWLNLDQLSNTNSE